MRLFSVHMPKTGGTTFQYGVLEKMFGDRLVYDCEENAYGEKSGFILDREFFDKSACIHGHYMPVKYRGYLHEAMFSIWFRHPITRSCSLYNITNRNFGWRPLELFCDDERNHNTMTRYMEGMEFSDFDFVGITEKYDESILLFSKLFPEAPTEPEPMRIWNPNGLNAPYELDEGQLRMLEEINDQDFVTYEKATKRFEEIRCTTS